MKSITLRADERLIRAARERARAAHSTLNEEFRRWLTDYVGTEERLARYDALMVRLLGQVKVGRMLTRDDMNER